MQLGVIAMVFSSIALAAHNILIKSLLETYSTAEVLLYRNLFSIVALFVILMFVQRQSMMIWTHPRAVHLRSLLSVVSWVLGIIAIKLLPLSMAVTIYATCPLLAAILAMLLKDERRSSLRLVTILIGFGGFVLIALEGLDGSLLGIGAALGSSLAQAVGIILVRRSGETSNTNVFTFNTLAMLILFSGSYVAATDAASVPTGGIIVFFALVGLSYLATVWFGTVSYRIAPVSYVAGLQNLPVVWLAMFDFFALNLQPTWSFFVGAGLLVASSAYLVASGNTSETNNRTLKRN